MKFHRDPAWLKEGVIGKYMDNNKIGGGSVFFILTRLRR